MQALLTRPLLCRAVAVVAPRGTRAMGSGGGGSSAHKAHVHMPETAMITNNGTHVFERKGWEYSTYMAFTIAPALLYLGITNAPETDSEVFARNEALAQRKGTTTSDDDDDDSNVQRSSRGKSIATQQYTYERSEIGERPTRA